jgi:hypothetical protein
MPPDLARKMIYILVLIWTIGAGWIFYQLLFGRWSARIRQLTGERSARDYLIKPIFWQDWLKSITWWDILVITAVAIVFLEVGSLMYFAHLFGIQ